MRNACLLGAEYEGTNCVCVYIYIYTYIYKGASRTRAEALHAAREAVDVLLVKPRRAGVCACTFLRVSGQGARALDPLAVFFLSRATDSAALTAPNVPRLVPRGATPNVLCVDEVSRRAVREKQRAA